MYIYFLSLKTKQYFLFNRALAPCLVFLGYGLPKITLKPLSEDSTPKAELAQMVSKSLWLYGGFTNLGVLAGECITPRKSYLRAVAILVPLKILLRFVPFLIAFSVATTAQINAADSTGLFNTLAGTFKLPLLYHFFFYLSTVLSKKKKKKKC